MLLVGWGIYKEKVLFSRPPFSGLTIRSPFAYALIAL